MFRYCLLLSLLVALNAYPFLGRLVPHSSSHVFTQFCHSTQVAGGKVHRQCSKNYSLVSPGNTGISVSEKQPVTVYRTEIPAPAEVQAPAPSKFTGFFDGFLNVAQQLAQTWAWTHGALLVDLFGAIPEKAKRRVKIFKSVSVTENPGKNPTIRARTAVLSSKRMPAVDGGTVVERNLVKHSVAKLPLGEGESEKNGKKRNVKKSEDKVAEPSKNGERTLVKAGKHVASRDAKNAEFFSDDVNSYDPKLGDMGKEAAQILKKLSESYAI